MRAPSSILAAVALVALLAGPAWGRDGLGAPVRTGHFVLETDCDPDTRDWVASRLEAFRSALEILVPAATGVPLSPEPIRVMLFEERERYAGWVAAHAPGLGHHGGYYDGATRTVVAYHRSNPLQLQFHEIAHAVMGDVFDDPRYRRYGRAGWPVWFDEGFAEYVSSWEHAGGDFRFGAVHPARLATLADALRRGRLPSVRELLQVRAERFSGPDMNLWYAAAWGLVDLLLSEPDLRSRVPDWVHRLRRGEEGLAAFARTFGPDLASLDERLATRIERLDADPPGHLALIDAHGLDAWTVHEGSEWAIEDRVAEGRGGEGWSYLTRAVAPMGAFSLDVEVQAVGDATLGLVLGHHAVDAYPYHTLVELEAEGVGIRHVRAADRIGRAVKKPGGLRAKGWTPVRLTLMRGVVSVWVDGRHVVSARAGGATLSLLGLWVQGGQGRFRRLALSPTAGYAGGPAAASPPRPSVTRDEP